MAPFPPLSPCPCSGTFLSFSLFSRSVRLISLRLASQRARHELCRPIFSSHTFLHCSLLFFPSRHSLVSSFFFPYPFPLFAALVFPCLSFASRRAVVPPRSSHTVALVRPRSFSYRARHHVPICSPLSFLGSSSPALWSIGRIDAPSRPSASGYRSSAPAPPLSRPFPIASSPPFPSPPLSPARSSSAKKGRR